MLVRGGGYLAKGFSPMIGDNRNQLYGKALHSIKVTVWWNIWAGGVKPFFVEDCLENVNTFKSEHYCDMIIDDSFCDPN